MNSWWRNRGQSDGDDSAGEFPVPEYIHTLASGGSSRVRAAVAANPHTPAKVLRTLALDTGTSQTVVAANPNLPQDILASLARHASVDVRAGVASNMRIPKELQRTLANDPHHHVRERLCANPGVALGLVHDLLISQMKVRVKRLALASDETLRAISARHPSTSHVDLQNLAADASSRVRSGVARNPSTAADILQMLAADPSGRVRRSLAQNPATPSDVLRALATDVDLEIRLEAGLNPNVPQEIWIDLFSSGSTTPASGKFEKGLEAQNPSTPPLRLADLAKDDDAGVRARVAKNPAIPPSVVSVLLWDPDETVRIALAANPVAIRSTIAADASVAPALLRILSSDCNWIIRAAVVRNSSFPLEEVEPLATDPNVLVRMEVFTRMSPPVSSLPHLYSSVLYDVPEANRALVVQRLPADIALLLAKGPGTEDLILRALWDGYADPRITAAVIANPAMRGSLRHLFGGRGLLRQRLNVEAALYLARHPMMDEEVLRALWDGFRDENVTSAVIANPGASASLLADIAQRDESSRNRAVACLNARIEQRSAKAALSDPQVSKLFLDLSVEVPDWSVSPLLMLNVTEMNVKQCRKLLKHPKISSAGIEKLVASISGAIASSLASQSDTTAMVLDVIVRVRSDEAPLIAVVGNPQRSEHTLQMLLQNPQASVAQAAFAALRTTRSLLEIAEIVASLSSSSVNKACANLPAKDALFLAGHPDTPVHVLRGLAEAHADEAVYSRALLNEAMPLEFLAWISERGSSPRRRALAAINSRTTRSSAVAALADARVSHSLMDAVSEGVAEIPDWVVDPVLLLNVTGMNAIHFIRLLSHPATTPEAVLGGVAFPRSHEHLLLEVTQNPDCTPEILEALMHVDTPIVCKAVATSPRASREMVRSWLQSVDVDMRIQLAGETHLSMVLQQELSRDSAEQVRDRLLTNANLFPEIALQMRRRISLELPE